MPPFHADIRHNNFFKGDSTMADYGLRLGDKGIAPLCNQGQVVFGKPDRWPTNALRKGYVDRAPDRLVWQDVRSFAPLFGDHPHVRFTHSSRLDVAVVCGDVDLKIIVDERFHKIANMTRLRPVTNLSMQAAAPHRASVNRVIDNAND